MASRGLLVAAAMAVRNCSMDFTHRTGHHGGSFWQQHARTFCCWCLQLNGRLAVTGLQIIESYTRSAHCLIVLDLAASAV